MTVGKWVPPVFTTQDSTAYKGNIDAAFAVAARLVDCFAPRALDTPVMKVRLDAGYVFAGTTLTEVAAQDSATITAPVGNPRIDRIVVDRFTGAVSVITGTPGAVPVAPAITSGQVPIAQVLVQVASTTITNSMITDERALSSLGRGLAGELNIGNGLRNDGSGNLAVSQMAANTFKGNNTGVLANPLDLTVTQATAMLNVAVGDSGSGGTKGLVPAPGAGDAAANKFLKADMTYATAGTSVTRRTWTGANDTIVAGDRGTLVVYTDTVNRTLAFTAAATLGNGFYVTLQNAGTGYVTLNPNGAELIDGLSDYVMYPGEIRLVMCTGSAFYSQVYHPFYLPILYAASPFTFTKPPGYLNFGVRLGAGGGGGGRGAASVSAGGGGGGGSTEVVLLASLFGATEIITIGAGGTGATGANSNGADGNNTTLASLATAYGGAGGVGNGGSTTNNAGGGGGGTLSKGVVSTGGDPGGGVVGASSTPATGSYGGGGGAGVGSNPTVLGGQGGSSFYGGGGGSGPTNGNGASTLFRGGSSYWGGGGGNGAATSTAIPATTPGQSLLGGGHGGQGGVDTTAGTNGTSGANGGGGGGGGGGEAANGGNGGNGSAAVWGLM